MIPVKKVQKKVCYFLYSDFLFYHVCTNHFRVVKELIVGLFPLEMETSKSPATVPSKKAESSSEDSSSDSSDDETECQPTKVEIFVFL